MIISIPMYELFDLYSIFCLLRSQVNSDNFSLIESSNILNILLEEFEKEDKIIQPNAIRKVLRDAKISMLEELWAPLYIDNVYTYFGSLINDKKELYYLVLAIKKLHFLCDGCYRQQAYDFLDTIHFMPILIAEQKKLPKCIVKKIIDKI